MAEADLRRLTHLSRFIDDRLNRLSDASAAYVGTRAFAHKGGMHVHGISRAASSYEHIEPERVGNERRFLVSELSGRSNIVALTTRHNLQHDKALMDKILSRVVEMENLGY